MAKVGTSNPDCTISLIRMQCVVENKKKNYTICARGTLGGTRSHLTIVGGVALDYYGPVLI